MVNRSGKVAVFAILNDIDIGKISRHFFGNKTTAKIEVAVILTSFSQSFCDTIEVHFSRVTASIANFGGRKFIENNACLSHNALVSM